LWGTSGPADASDKIPGIDTFYSGFGGSGYAGTSDEYAGTNGQVTSSATYHGHVVDGTAASRGGKTAPILAEVAKVIGPNPVPNGFYAVYTDLPRGNSKYCAWHSSGMINSVTVQFAFFWKLDGDPGCDPVDTSGLHSQGLAALANMSAHELSEARTDPTGAGWYDAKGLENGDKCNLVFNVPAVTFSNGSEWKVQGEWSNAVTGCISG
jgi:hypothetical protein